MAVDLREESKRLRLAYALETLAAYSVTVLLSRGTEDYPSFADALIEVNDWKVSRRWM